jgi:hypothetical protein
MARAQMTIGDEQELAKAVAQASRLIQDIQDYCGRKLREESKINFPRGLIGTANSYRGRCPGYLAASQTSSCAYGFMYLDVLWWLLSRTDIKGVARQMAIKSAIITLGTVLEVSLHIPGLPRNNMLSNKSTAGLKTRLEEALKHGWITKEQRASLDQLWDHRNNVHVKFLEDSELDLYNVDHLNSPHAALLALLSKLKAWQEERSASAAFEGT